MAAGMAAAQQQQQQLPAAAPTVQQPLAAPPGGPAATTTTSSSRSRRSRRRQWRPAVSGLDLGSLSALATALGLPGPAAPLLWLQRLALQIHLVLLRHLLLLLHPLACEQCRRHQQSEQQHQLRPRLALGPPGPPPPPGPAPPAALPGQQGMGPLTAQGPGSSGGGMAALQPLPGQQLPQQPGLLGPRDLQPPSQQFTVEMRPMAQPGHPGPDQVVFDLRQPQPPLLRPEQAPPAPRPPAAPGGAGTTCCRGCRGAPVIILPPGAASLPGHSWHPERQCSWLKTLPLGH